MIRTSPHLSLSLYVCVCLCVWDTRVFSSPETRDVFTNYLFLASFFDTRFRLALSPSRYTLVLSRYILPFRFWLLYALAIRVFQRLYTLHEISYSEYTYVRTYILQREEPDEGKTLWLPACTVASASGGIE